MEILAAIAVSLEKNCLKGFGVVIASLERASCGSSARTDIGGWGGFDGNDDRQRADEEENYRLLHTNSLADFFPKINFRFFRAAKKDGCMVLV